MTPTPDVLTELRRRGVTVAVDGNTLCLRPKRALDDGLLARVREHKEEILRELTPQGADDLPKLPKGVRLVHYEPKQPPVMIESHAVVTDVQKFIETGLRELDARLHAPVQIRGGFGVFTILDWLAQCGVELEIIQLDRRGEALDVRK